MKTCPTCKAIYPTHFTVCPKDGEALRHITEFSEGMVLRGKYKILSKLGQGGMGTVYKVRHLHFDELCALKVVGSHLSEDAGFLQRFRAEALVMRRLDHPHAVRVQDFDETEDGRPFMVMEYVEGESLDKILASGPPLHPRRAVRIAMQVCAALAAAHELGIIHRDIKPSNILLAKGPTGGDEVKVLDFGVAKVKESSTLAVGASLTRTGYVVGTPEYMSPEQARGSRGEELDGRTDLYSLGVVLYEMLTGRLPYTADTPVMMLMAHVQSVPIDPRTLRSDLPTPLVEIVLRALEKDPVRRFPSADAMREALEALEQDRTIRLTPAPTPSAVRPVRPPMPPPRAQPPPPVAGRLSPPGAKQAVLPAREIFTAAEPTPSRSTWLYAGLAGLALLAIVFGGLLFWRAYSPSSAPPSVQAPTAVTQPAPTPPTAPAPQPVAPAASHAAPAEETSAAEAPSPEEETTAMKPEVRALLKSGRQALQRGDRESAARFFRGALALDPNNRLAREGLRRAERAPAPAPTPPPTRANKQQIQQLMQQGHAALDRGNYSEAIHFFEAVLDIDPNNNEALRGLERARRALTAEQEILRPRR